MPIFYRTSATNLARIYNLDVPDASVRIQAPWSYQLQINTEQVWDAFFVHGLLLDCSSCNTILILDVSVPQDQRLHFALETRNQHMVGPGQKYWNHACNLCCAERKSPDGIPGLSYYHFIVILVLIYIFKLLYGPVL